MTAEAPPLTPDWPVSCGARCSRTEGGGAEQGADCLPASPPQRPLGSHENAEKRSCPRESLVPAGALSMLSRVRGEGSARAPEAVTEPAVAGTRAGLAAALRGSGQRTPSPGGGARAARRAGRAGTDPGSPRPRGGPTGTLGGLIAGRTFHTCVC